MECPSSEHERTESGFYVGADDREANNSDEHATKAIRELSTEPSARTWESMGPHGAIAESPRSTKQGTSERRRQSSDCQNYVGDKFPARLGVHLIKSLLR